MAWLMDSGPNRKGATWHSVLASWKAAEYIQADGGSGIRSGVEQLQKEREDNGGPALRGLDVFHTKMEASRVLRQQWQEAEAVGRSRCQGRGSGKSVGVGTGRTRAGRNRGLASAWQKRAGVV